MNTKGVEDGITDEQAVRLVFTGAFKSEGSGCIWKDATGDRDPLGSNHLACNWKDARAKLPLRSATPEELTAQAESYGKNYKPGPIQATPFMPNGLSKVIGTWPGDETDAELLSALDGVRGRSLPVPERTAEMRQLLYEFREQIAAEVRKHHDESPQEIAGFILTIKPDHIEAERERLQVELDTTNQLEHDIHIALDAADCPFTEVVEGEKHARWLNSRKRIAWLGAALARERELHQGLREESEDNYDQGKKRGLRAAIELSEQQYQKDDNRWNRAIRQYRDAIEEAWALLEDKSKPVATS